MPGRNGRGPMGEGPLTGRGLGNCSGDPVRDGFSTGHYGFHRGPGRGFGAGAGRRFAGWGRGFAAGGGPGFFGRGRGYATGWENTEDDISLEAREKFLEEELNRIRSLREGKQGDEA